MTEIYVADTNISGFDGTTEIVANDVVGTTYDGNYLHTTVCRYKFTTGADGATSLSFETKRAYASIRGSSSSDDCVGRMRFAVTDSATQYIAYQGNDGYAITQYKYGGWDVGWLKGSLSITLLPNKTYYLWVFPNSNFASWTRFSIGDCIIRLEGQSGQPSTISASNGTFGSAIVISLSNPMSSVTNTVSISVTDGTTTKNITAGSNGLVKNSNTKYTWTPALDTYGPWFKKTKSVTATITCSTAFGNSTKSITVTFPSSAAPSSPSATLTAVNPTSVPSTMSSLYIQGISQVKAVVTASGKHGATISSYQLTVDGVSTSKSSSEVTSSNVVTMAGTSIKATVKVTDSRGFTASATKTFSVYDYSPPAISSVSVFRSNSSGSRLDNGTYYKASATGACSSVNNKNQIEMYTGYKTLTGNYGSNTYLFRDKVGTGSGSAIVGGLSADVTYVVRIVLIDSLGTTTTATRTVPGQNWGLKFTVDRTNKKVAAAGIGKAPEAANVLEIPSNWNIQRGTQTALFSNGGTLTGNLSLHNSAPRYHTWSSDIDATIGNTVPSETTIIGATRFYDNQEWIAGMDALYKTTADLLYRRYCVRRKDANGNEIVNGFRLRIGSDGTQDVFFETGSRAAWRAGLGIGAVGSLAAINGLFAVEQKSFITSAQTVAAGGSISGTLSVAKSGYTALGPIGYYIQSAALSLVWNYMSAANTYRWAIGNPTGSSQSISAGRVYILYVKNSV